MLSIVSIGIGSYKLSKFDNIKCARTDAIHIYDAFKSIMEDEFSEHGSICLYDIFARDFLGLLNSLSCSLISSDDILVLYFSGHADCITNYGSQLDYSLCFADYNEELMTGYVSLNNQIIPAFNKINANIILILDCCFSGFGLQVASSHVGGNHISVFAASTDKGFAYYSDRGSLFSEAICKSIYVIKNADEDFTLARLQSIINNYYERAQLNIAAGSREIVIKSRKNYQEIYYDFEKRFIKKLSTECDDRYKEAMWYSLIEMPVYLRKRIFSEYFHCINEDSIFPSELNWLVRRAIGSTISNIDDVEYRKRIERKLLSSTIWQEQCIGIIGARYDIASDDSIYQLLIDKIRTNQIARVDAVWLANLYASDNFNYNYYLFLNSSLINSSWGINEVYKCAKNRPGFELAKFLDSLNTSPLIKQEWNEQYLSFHSWKKNSALYGIMSQKSERGRLPENSKAKFVLSSLYGNWRGYRIFNLKNYFNDYSKEIIEKELNEIQYFSEVEYRMSIFFYFLSEPELLKSYIDSLRWGLHDNHPWVRRTCIQCFKSAGILKKECNSSICNYIESRQEQIGLFDLLIEYSADDNTQFWDTIKKNLSLSNNEIIGLNLEVI